MNLHGHINTPLTRFNQLQDIRVVRKTADETVNNSNALQDDDHLFFSILANQVWLVRYHLWVSSSAVADSKVDITVPAACDGKHGNPSGFPLGTALSTAVTINHSGAAAGYYEHWAIIRNGATAGTVQLRWAQATAEVSDTIFYTNSALVAIRLSA